MVSIRLKDGTVIKAPACWDGKNLDSANHRDHVSYPSYGTWGYMKCPSTHSYVIPGFTLQAWWSVGEGDDVEPEALRVQQGRIAGDQPRRLQTSHPALHLAGRERHDLGELHVAGPAVLLQRRQQSNVEGVELGWHGRDDRTLAA